MGDIGWQEIMLVLIIALLLYGKNLPQVAKKVGNTYGNFKRKISDVRDDIEREIRNADANIDVTSAVNSDLDAAGAKQSGVQNSDINPSSSTSTGQNDGPTA